MQSRWLACMIALLGLVAVPGVAAEEEPEPQPEEAGVYGCELYTFLDSGYTGVVCTDPHGYQCWVGAPNSVNLYPLPGPENWYWLRYFVGCTDLHWPLPSS